MGDITAHDVKRIIKFYKTLPQEIALYERLLEDSEASLLPKSPSLDGLPKRAGVTDSTADKAFRDIKSGDYDHRRQIEDAINNLRHLQCEIFKEIKTLPYTEKMVVYGAYIDGKPWWEVGYKIKYSESQAKRYGRHAIEILAAKFNKNGYIKKMTFHDLF